MIKIHPNDKSIGSSFNLGDNLVFEKSKKCDIILLVVLKFNWMEI